jgi:exosortase
VLLGAALLWSSWPALRAMAHRWATDPRYSHGFLVPVFAAYLLWSRRPEPAAAPAPRATRGAVAAALALLAASAALKLAGSHYYLGWVDAAALLPGLAGLALLVGSWRGLRRCGPAIAFLVFMIPLPFRVEFALGAPLQRLATLASAYALQTLGLPAVAEGNTILLDEVQIGVVEACNGLGMLFMFAAFAVGAALVLPRPPAERVVLVVSAAPIALAANVARITLTGLLHATAGSRVADAVYHDLAGWLMMPLALAALALELALLARLFPAVEPAEALPGAPLGVRLGSGGPLGSARR